MEMLLKVESAKGECCVSPLEKQIDIGLCYYKTQLRMGSGELFALASSVDSKLLKSRN